MVRTTSRRNHPLQAILKGSRAVSLKPSVVVLDPPILDPFDPDHSVTKVNEEKSAFKMVENFPPQKDSRRLLILLYTLKYIKKKKNFKKIENLSNPVSVKADIKQKILQRINASPSRKHNLSIVLKGLGCGMQRKKRRRLESGGIAARYLIPFSARLSKHRIRRLEHVRRAKTGYARIGNKCEAI